MEVLPSPEDKRDYNYIPVKSVPSAVDLREFVCEIEDQR